MAIEYYGSNVNPSTLAALARENHDDINLPDEIQEVADVAEENGYVIKSLLVVPKAEKYRDEDDGDG